MTSAGSRGGLAGVFAVAVSLCVAVAVAVAQDAEETTYMEQWCTGTACFIGRASCVSYRQDLSDEGTASGECVRVPRTWALAYVRTDDGQDRVMMYRVRMACERYRRDLQEYNRSHALPHLYTGITDCISLRSVAPPDSDGDLIPDTLDACPHEPANEDDGCPHDWCFGVGELVTCAPSRMACEQARTAEVTRSTPCTRL